MSELQLRTVTKENVITLQLITVTILITPTLVKYTAASNTLL